MGSFISELFKRGGRFLGEELDELLKEDVPIDDLEVVGEEGLVGIDHRGGVITYVEQIVLKLTMN